MPTKPIKALNIIILLICLGLMVTVSVYSQFETEWAVFGQEEIKEETPKIEKAPEVKVDVKQPLTPLIKVEPELTVDKEAVNQEEFLFPQETTSKPIPKPKSQPKEKPDVKAGTTPDVLTTPVSTDQPEQEDQETKLSDEDSRGTSVDIIVQDEDNPWIPNIIENFFEEVLEKRVLVAYQVDGHLIPEIDGQSKEKAWLQSPILEVPIEKGPIVKVQAIYDEENIYFLFRWADEKPNQVKDLWHFDGSKWERKGEEDRIALMWNIDESILDFNIHACGMSCHDTDKNKQLHKMYTNANVEFADLWDWGASTSNPLGFAEDSYLDNQKFETKTGQHDIISAFMGVSVSVSKGGIHKDNSQETGSEENTNDQNTRPRYMIDSSKASDTETVLTHENSVQIEDFSIFKKGQTIPGHILRPLTGSRGDIQAKGHHKDGIWTLELKRPLNTGNTDDVQFNTAKSYYFGIATYNNTRQDKHKKSAKCLMRFKHKRVFSPALFFGILSVSIIFLVSLKKHDWESTDLRARGIFREDEETPEANSRDTSSDTDYRDTDMDADYRSPTDFDFYDDDIEVESNDKEKKGTDSDKE